MDELDKAVRFLKGIWPKVAGKNLEYAPYFVGNFTRSLHKENSPYCVYNNPICNEEEFEARAKELGWVNGYKWGKEYPVVDGKKPNLPDDVGVKVKCMQNHTFGHSGLVGKLVWSRMNAFKITDERYKPADETQPTDWHERGEFPPVGTACEIKNKNATPEWSQHDFYRVKIKALGDELFIMESGRTCNGNKETVGRIDDYEFRPIKTDRERFIEAAIEVTKSPRLNWYGQMFDAGFKAPEEK